MYWMKQQSRQENIVYLVVWGLFFAIPVLSLYVRTVNDLDAVFEWEKVFLVWRKFALYLLLFLVHNFLLAPLFFDDDSNGKTSRFLSHKRVLYFTLVAIVLIGFAAYQCSNKPVDGRMPMDHRPPMELSDGHQPPHFDEPRPFNGERPPHERGHHAPPPIIGEHDILAVLFLFSLFGVNLGIKGYFRSRNDHRRLIELEKQNLEQQLEYLCYQINPHFFMNTLNNIHALVDIDPEKAKETILEMSKLMRFVLYEGDKQSVALSREFDFIQHYVALMKLRFTEKVKISVDLPKEVPDRQIPPLLFITYVENAFKHGVSYQSESFIDVKVEVETDKLHFVCRNSKVDVTNQDKGGVGLVNARKRLDLLYANNYTLDIQDSSNVFIVNLDIPLKS